MNILGIDFGLKKVGIAIAISKIAEPITVLRYEDENKLVERIKEITQKELIEKIVVGVSEGQMAENSKTFGQKLSTETQIPVEFHDETLSTKDAIKLAIEGGLGRSKRKSLEDAFSATLMLQNYIDQAKL